ncbi:OsmC family protein [Cryobacterium psychrophilum]|uniref:Uncharacterized protein n=1 Tax=Cryobacterium psychrophilum TaxID=41988 RepID=A0A4Y8KT68_9MICO|nr:OsmC family protein [Cryobacterium psychrophilum]TDW29521.1 organic hydroperoxide reductase OsmC/OhrA [Cryobacterium psychrophilum]TFD81658.1 hypothetical protein E3T53_01225 [Cryobacterium psychrophilum]
MSTTGSLVPSTNVSESRGYPTREVTSSSAVPYGSKGTETYLSEVFGLGKFHKVGLVEEKSSGRTWCLQSDEGASLGGTNLAPAPLFHWLAGLQADVASRIAAVARARSIELEYLHVGVSQGLASKGSFARGKAVALIFGLDWDFDVRSSAPESEIDDIVDTAMRTSPAVAAMREAKEGLFALQTNGEPTSLEGLTVWDAPTVTDPGSRYDSMPDATGESAEQVFTFVDGGGQPAEAKDKIATHSSMDASEIPVGFYVDARGELDLETGLMRASTGLPEMTSDRWVVLMDPLGKVAPTPLAMFAIGTAFCYHTQLSRYVTVRRLDLADSSLAQLTSYTSIDPSGEGTAPAGEIMTEMFLHGGATQDDTRSLLKVAANTCYVHRAMGVEVAMTTDVCAHSV